MKNYIYLNQCFGQQEIDRHYYVDPPPYHSATQNATVDYGGVRWKNTGPGQSWVMVGMTGQQGLDNAPAAPVAMQAPSFQDVVNNAGSLNSIYQQGAQPAINTLGAASTDLTTRYQKLLDTITAQGSVAVNAQTLAENNVLGARGIDSSQGYGAQQLAQSLLPVTTANQSAVANLGLSESQSLVPIASAIANLQNTTPEAIQSALGIFGGQTQLAGQQLGANASVQAAQLQANAAIQAAQLQLQGYQAEANKPFAVPQGQSVFNPATGGLSYSAPAAVLPTVGGVGGNTGNITNKPANSLPTGNTPNFSYNPNYLNPILNGQFSSTNYSPVKTPY